MKFFVNPQEMSLEDEILSKSCKERANAISKLEKCWLTDKSSYSNLIPTLLKEKNVVVLEQLIPSFKVLPYAVDIATFVIHNFKTPRLKPRVIDYLNCKKKQLDIQLIFDLLDDKNPRFVLCLVSYLIEYYGDQGLPTPEQIEIIKKTFSNADASIRKSSVTLMQILYGRDNTLDLSGLKPIIEKEITEGTVVYEKRNVTNSVNEVNIPKACPDTTTTTVSFVAKADKTLNRDVEKNVEPVKELKVPRDEIPDDKLRIYMESLDDKSWKIRLDVLQQLQNSTYNLQPLTKQICGRLKDPNNMVFLLALSLIKTQRLSFEKETLLHRLSDRKLQEKIKEANIIELAKEDFNTQKNPEVLRMMVEILLYQKNKEFKVEVNQLAGSARKDLRNVVREYVDFCGGRIKPKNEQNAKNAVLEQSVCQKTVKSPINTHNIDKPKHVFDSYAQPTEIVNASLNSNIAEKVTKIDWEQNKNYGLPTKQEQQDVIQYFTDRYLFVSEKDYKQKLESMIKDEERLINEKKLLLFVYSAKEHNKIINLQLLHMLGRQQNVDTFLFCETFVRTFTEEKIFERFMDILHTLSEKKTILYFLTFIKNHKKGKLFECSVRVLKGVIKDCSVDLDILDVNEYIGKEKQMLIELKSFIDQNNQQILNDKQKQHHSEVKRCVIERKGTISDHHVSKSHENDRSVNIKEEVEPDVKVKSSATIDNTTNCTGDKKEAVDAHNLKPLIERSKRKKDGKDFEKHFTENVKTLFETRKVEASDFIIKHIFEEKECLCGRREGTACCLKELISYLAAHSYVLSPYEAEKLVQMIKGEKLLRMMEKIYPKTKIMMLKNEMSNFKNHIGRSFRMREYNMSPLTKKNKVVAENNMKIGRLSIKNDTCIQGVPTFSLHNEEDRNERISLMRSDVREMNNRYYTVTDKPFDNSLDLSGSSIYDSPAGNNSAKECPAPPTGINAPEGSPRSSQKYELFRKSFERRLSTSTPNDCLISELNKKDKTVLRTVYERAKEDIASLFYVANSLITGLISNLNDKTAVDTLMLLSSDKSFLSELDYMTLRMLHVEVIKDIQAKGGDILINLCLNAPVPMLVKVYLNILNLNKEIILKLIWRNSKRKYSSEYAEILNVYEGFFSTDPVLDEMSFKIVQLHVCELVKEVGEKVLEVPTTGVLRKILCGMLERVSRP
ncbi:Microtubule-associated protein [Trachipleistophora hominis]|uniref:Microtubule-associated protein n=1 Tax=Trachipleistophora hominis TaxID=72359 RepID=L7JYX7_TRAHO|nr:Microtubule-associated protein [Trachipleistophora hominis]